MLCRDTEERMCHLKSCHNQGAKQATEMSWPYNITVSIFGKLFYLLKCLLAALVWSAWRSARAGGGHEKKAGSKECLAALNHRDQQQSEHHTHHSLAFLTGCCRYLNTQCTCCHESSPWHQINLLPSSWYLSVSEISPWEFCAQSWRHFWGAANLSVSLLSIPYQVSVSLGPCLCLYKTRIDCISLPWGRILRITTVRSVQHSETKYQLHRALGCNKRAEERKGHTNKVKWIIYNQLQNVFKDEPTEEPFRPVKSMEPSALDVSVEKV